MGTALARGTISGRQGEEWRPRCTTEAVDERIEAEAEEKKFVTPRDIRRELQLSCCPRTVRRRLDEVNLFGRVAREIDDYDDRIVTLRMSFARGFLHFTDADWDTVIFSDEVHFCLGHHGQVWVQRPPGRAYDPQYCKPVEKEYEAISAEECATLAHSMHARLLQCIQYQGHKTKY